MNKNLLFLQMIKTAMLGRWQILVAKVSNTDGSYDLQTTVHATRH